MYYDDGYLHAVVEGLPGEAGPSAGREGAPVKHDGEVTRDVSAASEAPSCTDGDGSDVNATGHSTNNDVDADTATEGLATVEAQGLSRRQRQKLERKLKKKQMKQQARDLKRRRESEGSAKDSTPLQRVLRLHQFVSTAFRSELNVAENGTGHFVKNAPRVSAHHAILQGVVRVNGEVCKLGRTALQHGDVVSLQLEPEEARVEGELVSWRGSAEVAKSLEGNAAGNGKRLSRMASSADAEPTLQKEALTECEMVQYYREKLGKIWVPEVHESAMARPLPLTLRVLKCTPALDRELSASGFRPVTKEDVSLQVSSLDATEMQQLSKDVMEELLRDTWILDEKCRGKRSEAGEKRLGVFLSEARVTGEVMQQELTSMIPVAVLASHLRKQTLSKGTNLQLLDLCAAPGSKTCQLMSALERILPTDDADGVDFTVVANELNPQRANWMRHRLHQQSPASLSNLIVTCADGRDFAKMQPNSFDYIICDVPCSGDGTVRKSPKILTIPGKWSPKNAEKNKPVQKELLKVGLDLLKPSSGVDDGGILVYSTCSLNPVENEEAISEVLGELNGKEESSFRFELVGLSNSESGAARKDILRVLPARAHGGFFVAGIRKLVTSGTADTICAKKGPGANGAKHELIQHIARTSEKATMSYAISPGTQRCHKEITDTMGNEVIVSCGVAVIHEDAKGKHILQQGCSALLHRGLVGYVELSRVEMALCHVKQKAAFREAVLPLDSLRNQAGTTLIIVVDSTFLLPATKVKDVSTIPTDSVLVKILARPQVLRRALALT